LLADGTSFAREHEQRGLEGILGILRVPQNAGTYTTDKSRMAAHQLGKRGFIARGDEATQQLVIGEMLGRPRLDQLTDVPEHHPNLCVGHVPGSREARRYLSIVPDSRPENMAILKKM
jgi:hypothetical protein